VIRGAFGGRARWSAAWPLHAQPAGAPRVTRNHLCLPPR
jgi:hypothetical protein